MNNPPDSSPDTSSDSSRAHDDGGHDSSEYEIVVQIQTAVEDAAMLEQAIRQAAAETLGHVLHAGEPQEDEQTVRGISDGGGAMTVVLMDDDEVRALNRTYRGIDSATDVLSFPNIDFSGASEASLALPPELAAEVNEYLGDVVIAYPYAARQAEKFGNSLVSELRLLTVHGTLHLLGYDHGSHDEPHHEPHDESQNESYDRDLAAMEAEMWRLQETILARFGDDALSRRIYD